MNKLDSQIYDIVKRMYNAIKNERDDAHFSTLRYEPKQRERARSKPLRIAQGTFREIRSIQFSEKLSTDSNP